MRTLVLLSLIAAPAAAQFPSPGAEPVATARLLAGYEEDGGRLAGLLITLEPGWKTYWRAPGEAGIPPRFDWSGSANLAEVEVEWPAPGVFDTYGMTTLGYEDAVVLPIRVTPADPDAPLELRLALDYGVCWEVCIPERAEMALDVAPGAAPVAAAQLAAWRATAPTTEGVAEAECRVEGAGEERRFSARLAFDAPFSAAPLVVVEGPEGAWFGPSDTAVDGADVTAEAEVRVFGDDAFWIGREDLRLTVLGEGRAIDVRGCAG